MANLKSILIEFCKFFFDILKKCIPACENNIFFRKTVEAMGLRKLNKTVEMPDNPAVRGMIDQVRHLVKVEEV